MLEKLGEIYFRILFVNVYTIILVFETLAFRFETVIFFYSGLI